MSNKSKSFLGDGNNSISGLSASQNNSSVFDTLQNSDSSSPLAQSSSNSVGGFFKSITWQTWIIIFIVLAVLGFNVFVYLAKGTQFFANIIEKITAWFSGLFGNTFSDTAKQTINTSATGAKAGIDVAANTSTSVINATSNIPTGQVAYSSQSGMGTATMPASQVRQPQQDSLKNALNDSSKTTNVAADDSYSSIQMSKGSGKSGWCLIGEDKGTRSCMEVGVNDECMSGDIFPTQDVCVNPRLRA